MVCFQVISNGSSAFLTFTAICGDNKPKIEQIIIMIGRQSGARLPRKEISKRFQFISHKSLFHLIGNRQLIVLQCVHHIALQQSTITT